LICSHPSNTNSELGNIKLSAFEEWASILDIPSQWGFAPVRAIAIERLGAIASPIEKIMLSRRHGLAEWLPDAYVAMCERDLALTLDEARQIPLEDVVKIAEIRQVIRGGIKSSESIRPTVLHALNAIDDPATCAGPLYGLRSTSGNGAREAKMPTTTKHVYSDGRVRRLVTEGIELLLEDDESSHKHGRDIILGAVQFSEKHRVLIIATFKLIVEKGIEIWVDDRRAAARCADVLKDLVTLLEPVYTDFSLVDPEGNFPAGRNVLVEYISDVYTSHSTENFRWDHNSNHAGFAGELFSRELVRLSAILNWWYIMTGCFDARPREYGFSGNGPAEKHLLDQHFVEIFHTLLSAVGGVIDVPAAKEQADRFFNCWANMELRDCQTPRQDHSALVQVSYPTIMAPVSADAVQGLIALRARKWSRSLSN
jgi:hypothetical protein